MDTPKQYIILKTNLEAQLESIPVLPICLYGAPGLGKSSIISEAAADLGASENTVSISSVNFEFFTGIPTFATDENLDKYSVSGAKGVQATIWTIAELIASTNRMAEVNPNGVVLHLEDYHTMDKPTENVMYQLLLDRRLGDFVLHDKVAIVASMNNSEESGGGHFNSAAVKSRMSLMPYIFNFQYWYERFGRKLHPLISSFLQTNQQYIVEPESKTLEPSGSARSYTKLSLDFNLYDKATLNELYMELVQGKISKNASMAFERHVIYYQKIDFDTIVSDRVIPTLSKLPELDKVLWGYVFHSIVTPADALYTLNLVNALMEQPHYESVVGFLTGEIYTKYLIREEGQEITAGQAIVIDKLLDCYDSTSYNASKAVKEGLDETNFNNPTELASKMSEYM